MKIKYEIELEDLFIFSDYLIKTSPLMLRTVRKGKMWWAIGPLAGGLILSILSGYSSEKTLTTLAVLSVAISLPLFFMYTNYFKYRNKKQIKTFYEKDSYKGIIGPHEMTISAACLAEKTPDNDSQIQWDAINRIETTADHTFVFTDEITAYIIPHKKISGANASQFIDNL
ncbi:MAG: YcxB family protein, partial [Desulfuromonadales bacterium]|nr:YcxB family protein [Desulfuromonadales bacterium]